MANGHGGSRTPSNPAPVSAPGALSRRTDGGPQQVNAQMTGMAYGENADFMDIQSGAPMSATPSVRAPRGGKSAPAGSGATPLFSPTQRPDEPVTDGSDVGPGNPAFSSLTQNAYQQSAQEAQALKQFLPVLVDAANGPNAAPSFVQFVKYLRSM